MLQILAEIYSIFPEEGDMDRPKLAIFIDEAHLVFDKASDALMDQIEVIVKVDTFKRSRFVLCDTEPY